MSSDGSSGSSSGSSDGSPNVTAINERKGRAERRGSEELRDTDPIEESSSIYYSANDESFKSSSNYMTASAKSAGSVSLPSSSSRPQTIHSNPFPGMFIGNYDRKGPKDPNQRADRYKKAPAKRAAASDGTPPQGFRCIDPPFFTSKWPGVTWHEGVLPGPKKEQNVIVRKINEKQAVGVIRIWLNNERERMDSLDHKYILKYIKWFNVNYFANLASFTMVVFPKCQSDMIQYIGQLKQSGELLSERRVYSNKVFIGQIAQALAYMHERNYVHTRIHPSSIRKHGNMRVMLSRLMCVQKWSETKPAMGRVPNDPLEYMFISPERFRQEIKPERVFDQGMLPEMVNAMKESLLPTDGGRWDGKTDDVWAFGCVAYFVLTGNYPFRPDQIASVRSLLGAFKDDSLTGTILEDRSLTGTSREFLLWILKPNQFERPTMEQIVNHPWLQSDHPSSPSQRESLSDKPEVYGKTFKKVSGYISDNLVREMASKGYIIQHLLGQGGFGAVYKGIKLNSATGERRPIAMKVIKGDKSKNTFKTHRWSTEQKVMTFEHPNLVEVLDVFKEIKRPQHAHSTETRVFIFMELATMDLAELVTMKKSIGEQELVSIMVQVIRGLGYLHQHRVAHRDIKPHNILICGRDKNIAKLTDYSLVREGDSHTISRSYLGTIPYMAPELLLLANKIDIFKLDVWSLGITIYECITGRRVKWNPGEAAEAAVLENNLSLFTQEYSKMRVQVATCGKSNEVIDLMTQMLEMDTRKRFSLRQVKSHSWLSGAQSGGSDSDGTVVDEEESSHGSSSLVA